LLTISHPFISIDDARRNELVRLLRAFTIEGKCLDSNKRYSEEPRPGWNLRTWTAHTPLNRRGTRVRELPLAKSGLVDAVNRLTTKLD
jgi:hypothetical protein